MVVNCFATAFVKLFCQWKWGDTISYKRLKCLIYNLQMNRVGINFNAKTISFCLFRSQRNHHCTDDYIWTKFRPRSHLDQKTSRWLRSRCRIQVVASIQTSIRSIQAKMLFLLKGSAPILSKSVRNPNPSARGWSWTRIQFGSRQIRILLSPRPSFMQQHWSSWSPFWRNEIGKGKLN